MKRLRIKDRVGNGAPEITGQTLFWVTRKGNPIAEVEGWIINYECLFRGTTGHKIAPRYLW